jgi:hypothetical protein
MQKVCPCCHKKDTLKYHCEYSKYYYEQLIDIIRVKCCQCNITHAVIPSFSLPGTSHGVQEVEEYLIKKHEGKSRHVANNNSRISKAHTFNIDKSFNKAVNQAKSIFTSVVNQQLSGLAWIFSVIGQTQRPLLAFNYFCLQNHVNCIFFSRSNSLIFKPSKAKTIISLNNRASQTGNIGVDSS